MRRLVPILLLVYVGVAPALAQRVECGVLTGKVVHMVRPAYPEAAKAAGIQGEVVLEAVVGKKGEIRRLRVVKSAHPLLTEAAVSAVQQWRYEPIRLNGTAVEFEATIRVRFVLPKKKAKQGAAPGGARKGFLRLDPGLTPRANSNAALRARDLKLRSFLCALCVLCG